MTEREALLKRVQVHDFALNDAALFLDSHPDDQRALAYYKQQMAMRRQAAEAYIGEYGPLSRADYDGGPRWRWVDGPWPWQYKEA